MSRYGRNVEFSLSPKNEISHVSDEKDACFFINVNIVNRTLHNLSSRITYFLARFQYLSLVHSSKIFLGFTRVFCSQSEWGSTQNVLMIMLYWSEKISRNCTYLLPNTRSTHTMKNSFPPITVHRF